VFTTLLCLFLPPASATNSEKVLGQNHFAEPNWHVLIITEIGNCCGSGDHDGFSIPYSAESKSGAKQQKLDPTSNPKCGPSI